MTIQFNEISLPEKDEHKRTMDAKPSDFLNTFEKTIKDVARKYKVGEKDLHKYFEREMLGEYGWR